MTKSTVSAKMTPKHFRWMQHICTDN